MATIISAPFKLSSLSASFDPSAAGPSTITKPVEATLIAAGDAYLEYAQRTIAQRTFDQDDEWKATHGKKGKASKDAGPVEDDLGVGEEEEPEELLASDPKKWKVGFEITVVSQGINDTIVLKRISTNTLSLACRIFATGRPRSRLRLRVSHVHTNTSKECIIIWTHLLDRKKVLKHHPDKKAGAVGDSNDDAFFKCIQKAYEVLMHPDRRRQFDSIDPYFVEQEDEVPTAKDVENDPNPDQAFFRVGDYGLDLQQKLIAITIAIRTRL